MAAMPVDDDTKKQIVVHLDDAGNHGATVLRTGLSVTITKIRVQGVVAAGKNGFPRPTQELGERSDIIYTLAAVAGGSDVLINDNADFDGARADCCHRHLHRCHDRRMGFRRKAGCLLHARLLNCRSSIVRPLR